MTGRLRGRTLAFVATAAASAAALWLDGRPASDAPPAIVDLRSGARSLLPGLPATPPAGAVVRLAAGGASPVEVRFVHPVPRVRVAGAPAGPADPEAARTLWEDLRLARAHRRVPKEAFGGPRGTVALHLPGSDPVELEVGAELVDGSVAVRLPGEPPVAADRRLSAYLSTGPAGLLARRLLPVPPASVDALEIGGIRLVRDDLGLHWLEVDGRRHRVSEAAARAALERVLAAPLTDLRPRADVGPEGGERLATVETAAGPVEIRGVAGCGSDRVRVARGPGFTGCVLRDTFRPLSVEELFDRRLLPVAYARIVRLEDPQSGVVVARRPGGWAAQRKEGDEVWTQDLAEPRVFAWVRSLGEVRLDPASPVPWPAPETVRLRVVTDRGETLEIACGRGACRRDGEPGFAVEEGASFSLRLDPAALRDETLLSFRIEDVVGLSIEEPVPGGVEQEAAHDGAGTVLARPPGHPFPTEAVDELAMEALLSALSHLRGAEAASAGPALRRFVVRTADGRRLVTTLHDGCRASFAGRTLELAQGPCRTLSTAMLVYADPARDLLRRADRVTVERADGPPLRLRRGRGAAAGVTDTGVWEPGDDRTAARLAEALSAVGRLASFRARALEGSPPARAPTLRVTVEIAGRRIVLTAGDDWVRFDGVPWVYRGGFGEGEPFRGDGDPGTENRPEGSPPSAGEGRAHGRPTDGGG